MLNNNMLQNTTELRNLNIQNLYSYFPKLRVRRRCLEEVNLLNEEDKMVSINFMNNLNNKFSLVLFPAFRCIDLNGFDLTKASMNMNNNCFLTENVDLLGIGDDVRAKEYVKKK